jgi:hypothetical protein
MTFDEYLRTQGIGPREQDQLNPDRRERLRTAYWGTLTPAPAPAPAPAPSSFDSALTASNTTTGASAFDPQGQMEADYREDNPFASYSSLLSGQGLSTSIPQASAFNQWVNNEGWSGIENDYKTSAAGDPWDAPAIYDWMSDVKSPTNFSQMTGIKSTGGLADTLRLRYNQMTPQQRGVNSATGFKPARWAVF